MQKVPAFRGRFSFSPYIFKTFQIFPALSVNFKKGPWFDFFADVSCFWTSGTDDYAPNMLTHKNMLWNDKNILKETLTRKDTTTQSSFLRRKLFVLQQ
jgi:hypothetical protein